jgi:hypothetical protein
MQGVTAVCVPHRNFVYQRYLLPEDQNSFPRPALFTLFPEWPGDVRTGVFLGELLSHLDLEPGPKRNQSRLFLPIFNECRPQVLIDMFGPDWRPKLANGALGATLDLQGAHEYVKRVEAFRLGTLSGSEVAAGLESSSAAAMRQSATELKAPDGSQLEHFPI